MTLRSVATHDGSFHADEVTACALLIVYDQVDREKIVRTRDPAQMETCEYVCDVGGVYDPSRKLFDHHQVEYQGPLSSAGMVWQYFRDQGVVDEEEYQFLNEALILGVDAHDNGIDMAAKGVCTFSHIVSAHLPVTYGATPEQFEEGFCAALDFVIGYLHRKLKHRQHTLSYRRDVEAVMQQGGECLIFEERLPWIANFFALGGTQHPARFVIMPTGDGWKLRGIPPSEENLMGVRLPLPEEWAGLMGEELQRASGIEGAIFCHKGRFISVWKTKRDALAALHYVLEQAANGNHL